MSHDLLHFLLLAAAVLGLLALSAVLHRRGGRSRRELAERLHDHVLALSQRCDHLQEQVDALETASSVERLHGLLAQARRKGLLSAGAADRLDAYILDLRSEAEAERGPGRAAAPEKVP